MVVLNSSGSWKREMSMAIMQWPVSMGTSGWAKGLWMWLP